MTNAFTSEYQYISNRLINETDVISGENGIKSLALWDTGATCTCISHDIVNKLNLLSVGKQSMLSASGSAIVNVYLVDIILPNVIRLDNIKVCESEIGKQGFDLLIGMDIIGMGDFSVSNHNSKTVFTFRFPSQERTDYAKNVTVSNILNKGKHPKKKKKK